LTPTTDVSHLHFRYAPYCRRERTNYKLNATGYSFSIALHCRWKTLQRSKPVFTASQHIKHIKSKGVTVSITYWLSCHLCVCLVQTKHSLVVDTSMASPANGVENSPSVRRKDLSLLLYRCHPWHVIPPRMLCNT
jgi:hypothetical protein